MAMTVCVQTFLKTEMLSFVVYQAFWEHSDLFDSQIPIFEWNDVKLHLIHTIGITQNEMQISSFISERSDSRGRLLVEV